MRGRFLCLLFLSVGCWTHADDWQPDPPIECPQCDAWNAPQKPFKVFGNTYYVGTAGLASILIDGGNQLMLLDGALPQSAPLIIDSIRKLGFNPKKISAIGLSHAHFDHAGGVAALQRFSNAHVLTSHFGRVALEFGGLTRADPQSGFGKERTSFPMVQGAIELPGITLESDEVTIRGIPTPGHTPGGMSWTWQSCEGDRCLNIVYADSLSAVSAPGYRFSDGMDQKIRASAATIAALDCDILLTTHPEFINMHEKLEQGMALFIDPDACKRYAANALAKLERRLAREANDPP